MSTWQGYVLCCVPGVGWGQRAAAAVAAELANVLEHASATCLPD